MFKLSFIYLRGFIFYISSCFSQAYEIDINNKRFNHFTASGELSQNSVTSIKDNRGFMWIGTGNGLNKFDGYDVKKFMYNGHNFT